jgi:flagellar motor component MotA
MNKKIIGFFLFFTALWGGCYLYSIIPLNHWASVPTAVTVYVIGGIGALLIFFNNDDNVPPYHNNFD